MSAERPKYTDEQVRSYARQFPGVNPDANLTLETSGHINYTWTLGDHIIQIINTNVFPRTDILVGNTTYVSQNCLRGSPIATPKLALTKSGRPYHIEGKNKGEGQEFRRGEEYVRCYPKIEGYTIGAMPQDQELGKHLAHQAAFAFGTFLRSVVGLDDTMLKPTIEHFHDTPWRYDNLAKAIETDPKGRAKFCQEELQFVSDRASIVGKLLELYTRGLIPQRVTHQDTKITNVVFLGEGLEAKAKGVIDMDTVMPGLALYDFGDMMRTSTSPTAEDTEKLDEVYARPHLVEALVRGWLESAGSILEPAEKTNLILSGKVITLEIGIRFLEDYLRGDVYFKTHREDHNLIRARTQFKLVQSIEAQQDAFERMVRTLVA